MGIHHTAIVEPGACIGDETHVWHFAHIRSTALIGRDCTIGKDVYVEGIVGDRCKIQNGVSVYRGVTLGNRVFVGPYAVFTNDLAPRATSQAFTVIPTRVEHDASIGANATIICGVTIGHHAMVGAGAVVTRDVKPYRLVLGNPARVHGVVCPDGHPLRHWQIGTMTCDQCQAVFEVPA